MFALLDTWIDQEHLSETWHEITGDSFIVDIRRKKDKQYGYSKAAAEVCKYALKFGDLSVEHTWEAFKVLKGKRLSGAFGSLWGVKIPENLADDMPDEKDLPYLEMLYTRLWKTVLLQLRNDTSCRATCSTDELRSGTERMLRACEHDSVPYRTSAGSPQKATLASRC